MRPPAVTAILLLAPLLFTPAATPLAQGVSSNGVVFGDGRDPSQDFIRPGETPARPSAGTTAAERARRAERQRQINQNFSGTGRPVAAPPTPPAPARTSAAPVAPPAAPAPVVPAQSAAARPPVAAGPAETRAGTAAPPPGTRAAPVVIQPGQSTGAARGTPASR
ncbi:hypothetical protein KTR66_15860 [Roseococcus sp. SDR]|uniref:hypothetical protein n=1 Tax=Roseococcus sp. SDR TaxID=2835532 RepID=UPI001BD01532|nr:hypothetical protein [Roseococcus sp. SDR]MBS7791478.1 hypothetical protein [Roseococcus sp. SDR]MBV1846792.1 hypothetical protein [Roseococcus sp. SDR]